MRYSYKTKFLSAVDGDTVKIMIDHGLNIFSTQVLRLARINTPELKSSDEAIRIKAIEAKTKVQKFCETAHEVTVEIVGKDVFPAQLGKKCKLETTTIDHSDQDAARMILKLLRFGSNPVY